MVFSPELGYDPEEWEECGDSDHLLAFGFFTRIWLTLVTVGLAGAFFWVLEARKEWSKIDREQPERQEVISSSKDEPPKKPERRMSLEAMKAAEEMRREAAAATAAASVGVVKEPEIQSPQRDARSSVSVERRLRQGASLSRDEVEAILEADRRAAAAASASQGHPISPEPPSNSFALPSGAFDNITELHELDKAAAQATDPEKKQSLDQQYRALAKAIERKLLTEIEQLGLLQGRHNEKDAPRQIAEQIQHKHQKEIHSAVDELVKRESGDPYVADHFRKQLENQIEDAVWQYNQTLLHATQPKDLYETELGPNDEPVWKPRTEQQPPQAQFDFTASVLDQKQTPTESVVAETVPLFKQPPQGLQVPPQHVYEPLEEGEHQPPQQAPPRQPESPKILINNQQKGSSSSEDGFIKVYPESIEPSHRQQDTDFEGAGAVGSPRPSSYDAGSSVTADDIEFVHSTEGSPRLSDYPDVFTYDEVQRVDKSRPSDEFEGFETIPAQNIWQSNSPQQQQPPIGVEIEAQKKPLNPEEAAHMAQLLKEYDLNSLRDSVAEDPWQHRVETQQQQNQPSQAQQGLPNEIWQREEFGEPQGSVQQTPQWLQQQQTQQSFQQQAEVWQNQHPNQQSQQPPQPSSPPWQPQHQQSQQPEAWQNQQPLLQHPQSPKSPQWQQKQQQQNQQPPPSDDLWQQQQQYQQQAPTSQAPQYQEHPQIQQLETQQPSHPQQGTQPPQLQQLQGPKSPKRSKTKSPVQMFNEGDNIAEFLFQMSPKTKEPQPTEQKAFADQVSKTAEQQLPGETHLASSQQGPQEPDDDPHRLAAADIYVQDAIEYIEAQRPPSQSGNGGNGGFVIEEDMLESDKHSPQPPPLKDIPAPNLSELEKQLKSPSEAGKQLSQQNISADPTSRMIRTNEVFTARPDPSFDDADDAITSAPEIQSIEIPPDQMSENSSNIMDNYDYQPGSSGAYSPPLLIEPLPNLNNDEREVRFAIDNDRLNASPSPKPRRGHGSPSSTRSPEAPQLWRVSPVPYDETPSLSISERHIYKMRKQSSLLSVLNVTSMQEMLLTLTSLEGLAAALRRAGLESTNIIFGIDYTASNKYQGENSFGGRSLHSVIDASIENPYQQVIRIMGNSLASFATSGSIPVYGFGDAATGDWSVFKLKEGGECKNLDEVLRTYNHVTPNVELSGPTNFAPLIYEAMKICARIQDYHILIIVADGQVTNERATRKAIVKACEYPLSIIVVGVGDGPWHLMRVFDESLPKRPWDNFHFVEFNEIVREHERSSSENELAFAIQSLLEIPDQYAMIRRLGLIGGGSRAD